MHDMVELQIRSHVMSTYYSRQLAQDVTFYKVWSVVVALWQAGHILLLICAPSTYAIVGVIVYYAAFLVIVSNGLEAKETLERESYRIEQREQANALWEKLYGDRSI